MPEQPMTVVAAVASGSTRNVLVATRDRVATAVDDANTPARDLAALTKRVADLTKEIEAIDARAAEEGGSGGETPADAAFDPKSA